MINVSIANLEHNKERPRTLQAKAILRLKPEAKSGFRPNAQCHTQHYQQWKWSSIDLNQEAQSWPTIIKNPDLLSYCSRRDSLSTLNGSLLLAHRVVITAQLQPRVLRQLHKGHPGIVWMKALVRSHAYWPGINKDIEDTVRRCSKCSSVSKLPVRTTLASWPLPDKPWSRIHVDYAGPFEGSYFLALKQKYTSARRMLNGESEVFSEINLPDFGHLIDVFLKWTGTLLITHVAFRRSGKTPQEGAETKDHDHVESSRSRPTEAMVQQRIRQYEYANLGQDRPDICNRRGGVYHYLVMLRQLNVKQREQKKDLIPTMELFKLANEWYEILVIVGDVDEMKRPEFIHSLNDQNFYEPSAPGDKEYPNPMEYHRYYDCIDVATTIRYTLFEFDGLLEEEQRAIDETESETRRHAEMEDAAMRDMTSQYSNLRVDLRHYSHEMVSLLQRVESMHQSMMTQIQSIGEGLAEVNRLLSKGQEDHDNMLMTLKIPRKPA
ncbi:unnamed protein product [Heligmosomoides polygyrus]|uniref:RNA-directed DNA polymerase n=1 Tax=Heligmosomoides polygyrus TaxID=6339 RepID=A0A183FU91_HELPZ|nr:unnamed protein product [Heligmosomoides polygyrus]